LPGAIAQILRPARTVVVLPQVQANPLGPSSGQWVSRQTVLAPLPRVDWDFIKLAGDVWSPTKLLGDLLGGIVDDTFGAITRAITGVLGDMAGIIWSGLQSVAGVIGAGVLTAAQVVGGVIGAGVDLAGKGLGAVWSAATGVLSATVGFGLSALSGALGGIGDIARVALNALGGVIGGAVHIGAGIVGAAISAVAKPIGAALTWLGTQVAGIGGAIIGGLLGIAAAIAAGAGDLIVTVLVWLRDHVLEPIIEIAQNIGHWVGDELGGLTNGDPEAVLPLAMGLLAAALPLGVAAHGLAVAAEHTHPLKHVGYTTIARLLVDMTNIQKISDASIGGAFTLALTRPMEYWLSRRIRYKIPDPRDIQWGYTKRDISEGDARLYMAYHGFNESRISAIMESMWAEPSMMTIRRLVDSGTLPSGWLRMKIRRGGYRDDDVDAMAAAVEHNQFATQRGELYNAAYGLLAQGVSTPGQFAADVGILELHPDQIALATRAAAMKHANDLAVYQAATLLTQAKNGLITVDDLGVGLTALGMNDDRVRAEQARARTAIAPKIAAKIQAAAQAEFVAVQRARTSLMVQRFRRGLIDQAALYTNLVAVGLDPDLATTTVDIELARRTPLVPVKADNSGDQVLAATLKQLQKTYTDQYRVGMITDGELSADLTALGMDPALVLAVVADELARKYVPPDTTPAPPEDVPTRVMLSAVAGLYRDQFRAGLMDAPTYGAALVAAGMDPDLAAVTVQREQLRISAAVKTTPPA
jgi:hypothetical protein